MTAEAEKIVLKYFIDDKLQIDRIGLTVAAACLLPFLFHWIPWPLPVPIGAAWLPIFYAPAVAALFFRPHVALTAAVLSPALNHWMTGRPAAQVVPVLTTELLFFSVLLFLLLKVRRGLLLNTVLAYGLAKGFSFLVWSAGSGPDAWPRFAGSMGTALPGIVVLLLINLLAVQYEERKRGR